MKVAKSPVAPGSGKKKVLVGISGGMNSAVTAALLQSQGYQVTGVFLRVVDPKAPAGALQFSARCCLTKNQTAAQQVCRKLDIPFQVLGVESRFEDKVIDAFVHGLLQTRQFNPCVPCNLEIRFDALFKKAAELGCEQVATGHHAQILHDAISKGGSSSARLQRGANAQKDQSYFLFGLNQKQLSNLIFPLGGFQDVMIERLAREFDLPDTTPGNPQEVCLSKGEGHLPFFEARVPQNLRPGGNIKTNDGAVLGEHRGLYAYRVGQQKIKLAAHVKDSEKFIVTGFDVVGKALLIGHEKNLFHSDLRASHATWIKPVNGLRGLETEARFSSSQKDAVPCRVTHFENSMVRVEFELPQKGLIVGSAIVFFDGDEVLGGAFIESVGSLPQGE